MKGIRFLASARLELLAETSYYSESGTGTGEKFAHAVEEALSQVQQFPLSGSSGPSATRTVMVKGFPFSIFYLENDAEIVVVALAHHSRRPGYWIDRLKRSGN